MKKYKKPQKTSNIFAPLVTTLGDLHGSILKEVKAAIPQDAELENFLRIYPGFTPPIERLPNGIKKALIVAFNRRYLSQNAVLTAKLIEKALLNEKHFLGVTRNCLVFMTDSRSIQTMRDLLEKCLRESSSCLDAEEVAGIFENTMYPNCGTRIARGDSHITIIKSAQVYLAIAR